MQLVIEKLNEILSYIRKTGTSRYMDIKELSEFASISRSTIRRNVKDNNLKASKTTGKLLFKAEDVEKWLSN